MNRTRVVVMQRSFRQQFLLVVWAKLLVRVVIIMFWELLDSDIQQQFNEYQNSLPVADDNEVLIQYFSFWLKT